MSKKTKKAAADGEMYEVIKGAPPARTSNVASKYDAKLKQLQEDKGNWVRLYKAPEGATKKAAHARRQSLMRAVERAGVKDKISAQVRRDEDGSQGLWAIFG
jgi:hypothetical protein